MALKFLDRVARTMYIDAVYCYRPNIAWSVCRSVTLVSRAKTAEPSEPIEMPLGLRTQVGPGNHVLDGIPIPPPMGRGVPL